MNKKCSICGGPSVFLGKLGSLRHYRCRNCGMMEATGRFGRKAKDPNHKIKKRGDK